MIAYKGFAKVSCVENGSLGSPLSVGLAGGTNKHCSGKKEFN